MQSRSPRQKRAITGYALCRPAAAALQLGMILWVAFHPSGRKSDFLDFRGNAAYAVPVAAVMAVVVALYLLAGTTSAFKGTTVYGCGSALLGGVVVLIAAFTLIPKSWSQQELWHFVGNALWVTVMPGIAIFAIGLRFARF